MAHPSDGERTDDPDQDSSSEASLAPYVPRVAAEWQLDAPGRSWQAIDGTLCFVDISGFTKLSERLAARGRIGAEQLTDVLGHVFGTMLDLAYDRGGSLLKFGGDALLLLFRSERHALDATCAAVEMRTALRNATRLDTPAGRIRLRMSVGVHSGAMHVFLVGASHRELVIAGPGATTTTRMEKDASAGEIVVSEATRALLPAAATGAVKGAGWLLRWRRSPFPSGAPVPRRPVARAAIDECIARALLEHLRHGRAESEHRIATVGFVRFEGFDAAMRAGGLDATAAALTELVSSVQRAVDAEDVTFLATDIDEDGGKVILTTGVPVAREDDEGRMLRALRSIADSPLPFLLKIGVNRGHVFAGEIGHSHRRAYTVMGDTVNLAARLMAASPAGGIYATAGVLERSRTLFGTTALAPFHVKGKSAPVQAFALGEDLGPRPSGELARMPFVGRATALGVIAGVLDAARVGAGGIVTVVGDPGMGKTRLIREALAAEPGMWRLEVRGEPFALAAPYRAVRDPLRARLGLLGASAAEMTDLLASAVARVDPGLRPMLPLIANAVEVAVPDTAETAAIEPRFRPDRVADAVAALLARVLTEPGAIVVDDAHWVDEASSRVLARIADTAPARPWAMIVAARREGGGFRPSGGPTTELEPLSEWESEAVVLAATSRVPLRPHEVTALVHRCGGNPLFLSELLRSVAELGGLESLPDTLGAVVSAQIDALDPLERRLLRHASVLGASFGRAVLADVVGEAHGLESTGARVPVERFLEPEGPDRIRFRHAMVRDVAYEGLSYQRRRSIHARAAEVIERQAGGEPLEFADALALHWFHAQDYGRAWRYARVAGERAKRAHANVAAAAHFERALAALRRVSGASPADEVALLSELGDVREEAGLFEGSLDAYRAAYRRVGADPLARAGLCLKRARAWERLGRFTEALRALGTGHRALAELDTPAAARAGARLASFAAWVRYGQQRLPEAIREARRSVTLGLAAGEPIAVAGGYEVLDLSHRMLGRSTEERYAAQALEIYTRVGDLRRQAAVTGNLGTAAYFDGKWDEARALYEQSREASLRAGNVVQAAQAAANAGELLANQARTAEAEPLLRDAGRVLRASNLLDGACFAEIHWGRTLAAMGRLEEAERALERARDDLLALGAAVNAVEAAVHLAACAITDGRAAQALAILADAEHAVGGNTAVFAASVARVRAEALVALGRVEEAVEAATSGLVEAERQQLPYEIGLLLLARADASQRAGRSSAAEDRLRAEQVLNPLGVPGGHG